MPFTNCPNTLGRRLEPRTLSAAHGDSTFPPATQRPRKLTLGESLRHTEGWVAPVLSWKILRGALEGECGAISASSLLCYRADAGQDGRLSAWQLLTTFAATEVHGMSPSMQCAGSRDPEKVQRSFRMWGRNEKQGGWEHMDYAASPASWSLKHG